jgi:hypothetical protein
MNQCKKTQENMSKAIDRAIPYSLFFVPNP